MYSSSPERDPSSGEVRSQRSRSRGRKRRASVIQRKLCGPLPESETGQRLAKLFPNGWDWIYADAPSRGTAIEWETIQKYPLGPVEQWTLHQDPSCIIGIRPNSSTRWGIIDIDRNSKYHPASDPNALTTILNALEDIGLCRTLINQSSHSKGIHIYIPLPEFMSSFGIAVVLKYTLEAAGIQIRSGQCETFPNPKRYIPQGQGFSLYNGIRMPMQPNTGFIPLDQDLNPLHHWSLEDWLDSFESAAAHQDLNQLCKAIADAEHNHRIRGHRNPHSLESWSTRIEEEKKQGWTGPGQTNDKLKLFACEARVFLNMDSEQQIATHIEQTARATPGFQEYSGHTKDLGQRSKDVATWAMRYYWPMGAIPSRDTGYQSQPAPPADFSYHQAKREAAQQRIRQAVAELKAQSQLPETATARAKAIAQHAHISQQTLYKPINKPLWHPEHQSQPKEAEVPTQQDITPQEEKGEQKQQTESPQPLSNKRITQLYIYEGFVIQNLILGALEALALKGQRATEKALPDQEAQERGGAGGETTAPEIQGWADLRKSLPVSMQEKIAKAERSRQRKDELEQKRRERAQAKRQQLQLDFDARPRSPAEGASSEREDPQHFGQRIDEQSVNHAEPEQHNSARNDRLQNPLVNNQDAVILGQKSQPLEVRPPGDSAGGVEDRAPTAWERDDFNTWYGLAAQCKLVTDYQWRDSAYWVLANGRWMAFCEMVGMFSCAWLCRYFGGSELFGNEV